MYHDVKNLKSWRESDILNVCMCALSHYSHDLCGPIKSVLHGEAGGRGIQDGGTHVHPRLIHVKVCQKPLQYCKVISLQLK